MEENETWLREWFETEDKHCWHAGHEQIHVANYMQVMNKYMPNYMQVMNKYMPNYAGHDYSGT